MPTWDFLDIAGDSTVADGSSAVLDDSLPSVAGVSHSSSADGGPAAPSSRFSPRTIKSRRTGKQTYRAVADLSTSKDTTRASKSSASTSISNKGSPKKGAPPLGLADDLARTISGYITSANNITETLQDLYILPDYRYDDEDDCHISDADLSGAGYKYWASANGWDVDGINATDDSTMMSDSFGSSVARGVGGGCFRAAAREGMKKNKSVNKQKSVRGSGGAVSTRKKSDGGSKRKDLKKKSSSTRLERKISRRRRQSRSRARLLETSEVSRGNSSLRTQGDAASRSKNSDGRSLGSGSRSLRIFLKSRTKQPLVDEDDGDEASKAARKKVAARAASGGKTRKKKMIVNSKGKIKVKVKKSSKSKATSAKKKKVTRSQSDGSFPSAASSSAGLNISTASSSSGSRSSNKGVDFLSDLRETIKDIKKTVESLPSIPVDKGITYALLGHPEVEDDDEDDSSSVQPKQEDPLEWGQSGTIELLGSDPEDTSDTEKEAVNKSRSGEDNNRKFKKLGRHVLHAMKSSGTGSAAKKPKIYAQCVSDDADSVNTSASITVKGTGEDVGLEDKKVGVSSVAVTPIRVNKTPRKAPPPAKEDLSPFVQLDFDESTGDISVPQVTSSGGMEDIRQSLFGSLSALGGVLSFDDEKQVSEDELRSFATTQVDASNSFSIEEDASESFGTEEGSSESFEAAAAAKKKSKRWREKMAAAAVAVSKVGVRRQKKEQEVVENQEDGMGSKMIAAATEAAATVAASKKDEKHLKKEQEVAENQEVDEGEIDVSQGVTDDENRAQLVGHVAELVDLIYGDKLNKAVSRLRAEKIINKYTGSEEELIASLEKKAKARKSRQEKKAKKTSLLEKEARTSALVDITTCTDATEDMSSPEPSPSKAIRTTNCLDLSVDEEGIGEEVELGAVMMLRAADEQAASRSSSQDTPTKRTADTVSRTSLQDGAVGIIYTTEIAQQNTMNESEPSNAQVNKLSSIARDRTDISAFGEEVGLDSFLNFAKEEEEEILAETKVSEVTVAASENEIDLDVCRKMTEANVLTMMASAKDEELNTKNEIVSSFDSLSSTRDFSIPRDRTSLSAFGEEVDIDTLIQDLSIPHDRPSSSTSSEGVGVDTFSQNRSISRDRTSLSAFGEEVGIDTFFERAEADGAAVNVEDDDKNGDNDSNTLGETLVEDDSSSCYSGEGVELCVEFNIDDDDIANLSTSFDDGSFLKEFSFHLEVYMLLNNIYGKAPTDEYAERRAKAVLERFQGRKDLFITALRQQAEEKAAEEQSLLASKGDNAKGSKKQGGSLSRKFNGMATPIMPSGKIRSKSKSAASPIGPDTKLAGLADAALIHSNTSTGTRPMNPVPASDNADEVANISADLDDFFNFERT